MTHFKSIVLTPTDKELEEVGKIVNFLDELIDLTSSYKEVSIKTSDNTIESLSLDEIQTIIDATTILEGAFY